MWRIRFQDKRNPDETLITKSGVHDPEAAAFYAEAILANPDDYTLLESDGKTPVSAVHADGEYLIENYWTK